jgi:hypothetical protein
MLLLQLLLLLLLGLPVVVHPFILFIPDCLPEATAASGTSELSCCTARREPSWHHQLQEA